MSSTVKLILTILAGALAGAQGTGVLPASTANVVGYALFVLTALGFVAHKAAITAAKGGAA